MILSSEMVFAAVINEIGKAVITILFHFDAQYLLKFLHMIIGSMYISIQKLYYHTHALL